MRVRAALVISAFALYASAGYGAQLPTWISLESNHGSKDVELFYRALTAHPGRPEGKSTFEAGDASRFDRNHSSESGIEGEWAFFGIDGASAPQSAIRRRLPTHAPYRVRVDMYCEGASCDSLRAVLANMPAPRVFGDPALVAGWRKIVAEEPCDPLLPENRPHRVYPREELRRGIVGTAVLSVFHNRCGDVRDATIETSSGNRNLDRGALMSVLRWRVRPASGNTAGWKRERIDYRPGDPADPQLPNHIDVSW